jgi:iron complex transport system substrate-binding protein
MSANPDDRIGAARATGRNRRFSFDTSKRNATSFDMKLMYPEVTGGLARHAAGAWLPGSRRSAAARKGLMCLDILEGDGPGTVRWVNCGRPRNLSGGSGFMALTRFFLVLGVLLLVTSKAVGADSPQRIVSLNLCTDQLLMALVQPVRIASISWLSRTEGDPVLLPLAQRLPVNRGSAEEVLALRPDLVIAGRFTTATTRALLRKVGVPLLEVDSASDWEGVRRITRTVAAAVGEPEQGEELLRQMDADLARLAQRRPAVPYRAIGWSGAADDVPGRDTMFNTILETAGALNLGAREGAGTFDLEQVLLARPQVLLRGAAYGNRPALRNELARHRVLGALPGLITIEYPEAVYGCGVPRAAQLAGALADRLAAAGAKRQP